MKNREEGYFYMSEDQIVEYLKENLEENANICVGKRFGLVPYVNVKTEGLKGCFRLHLINNGVLYVEIIDETGNSIQSKFFNDDKFFYEKFIEKRHKMILDLFSIYYKKIREYLDLPEAKWEPIYLNKEIDLTNKNIEPLFERLAN